jgi:23S rRNA (adenine2503-C2)-methyltransferase
MTNLPKDIRELLTAKYELSPLKIETVQGSEDTTRKYLWALRNGDYVESVLIPANVGDDGERADRTTLCVSSQVGCAYGCKFCASGLDGFKRNLTPGEIVAQVIEAERHSKKRINNLVFMGMGEPLANYKNLIKALEILNADWGVNIGARHITVSTSGIVPMITKLAEQPKQFRLAISLHGATNPVRDKIMPVNAKYPVEELLDACDQYQQTKNKMITLEYILIKDINDMTSEASILAKHAKRLNAKVNLIPYNTVEGLDWERPSEKKIFAFADILHEAGITATVRMEKGHDIDAACGQLRLKKKNENAS